MRSVLRLALACAALAAAPAAQEEQVLQDLVDAKQLRDEGRAEDAALRLRAARAGLEAVEDPAVRRRLERSVLGLLAELDPLDAEREKAFEAVARELLKPARAYQRRKWHRAALPLLEAVAAFSEKIGGKALAQSRDEVEGGRGAPRPAEGIEGWLKAGLTFAGGGYWKVQDGIAESPTLGLESLGLRSERRTAGPTRISIEVLASSAPSKAAIVFAMEPSKNGDDYYILELRHERGFSQLRLLHNAASGGIDEIVNQAVAMARAERADWTELWVELRGDLIRIGLADLESAETRSVTPDLDGVIGLFVSGDSPFKAPVRFRNLRIEKL
jgi:hypothetical protein